MATILRIFCVCILFTGCSHTSNIPLAKVEKKETLIERSKTVYIEELSQEIVAFDDVAYGLGIPLRRYLQGTQIVKGKAVLDLGAGTGVLSLIALKNGARNVVATDINSNAVSNAIHNAELFGFEDRMDVRLVSMDNPGAYSVVDKNEIFDLVVSNPPQIKAVAKSIYEYSFNDLDLSFLRSIIEGLKDHLTPEGRGVFALYDEGLKLANQLASDHGLDINIHLKTYNRYGNYYIVEITRRQPA